MTHHFFDLQTVSVTAHRLSTDLMHNLVSYCSFLIAWVAQQSLARSTLVEKSQILFFCWRVKSQSYICGAIAVSAGKQDDCCRSFGRSFAMNLLLWCKISQSNWDHHRGTKTCRCYFSDFSVNNNLDYELSIAVDYFTRRKSDRNFVADFHYVFENGWFLWEWFVYHSYFQVSRWAL